MLRIDPSLIKRALEFGQKIEAVVGNDSKLEASTSKAAGITRKDLVFPSIDRSKVVGRYLLLHETGILEACFGLVTHELTSPRIKKSKLITKGMQFSRETRCLFD